MSALNFISAYDSSSEESESENHDPIPKKIKYKVPNLSRVPVVSTEVYFDDPDLHNGRVRSFPHVRGNWPSYVYVLYPKAELLENLLQRIECDFDDCCHRCEDLHISLSKTVVLKYHLINTFTKSLQEKFNRIECFEIEFSEIKVYCNEDKTRTFLALEVDYLTKKQLLKIANNVDEVLADFNLPLFYEDPSFHMSILWFNGDRKKELSEKLSDLNASLSEELVNTRKPVVVHSLSCKVGNKYFQFSLQ